MRIARLLTALGILGLTACSGDVTASHPVQPYTVNGHELNVLCSGGPGRCAEGLPCTPMANIWLELQDEYAALLPDARHVEANTGHYVQDQDPDLVVREILSLLDRIDRAT